MRRSTSVPPLEQCSRFRGISRLLNPRYGERPPHLGRVGFDLTPELSHPQFPTRSVCPPAAVLDGTMPPSQDARHTGRPPGNAQRRGSGVLLDVVLWAWLLAVVGWTHVLRFDPAFEWDSTIFLVMGKWVSEGVVPYREMEIKPPGIFLYLGALLAVCP